MISFLFEVLLVKPLVIAISESREEFRRPHFFIPSPHVRLEARPYCGAGSVLGTPSRLNTLLAVWIKLYANYVCTLATCDRKGAAKTRKIPD